MIHRQKWIGGGVLALLAAAAACSPPRHLCPCNADIVSCGGWELMCASACPDWLRVQWGLLGRSHRVGREHTSPCGYFRVCGRGYGCVTRTKPEWPVAPAMSNHTNGPTYSRQESVTHVELTRTQCPATASTRTQCPATA